MVHATNRVKYQFNGPRAVLQYWYHQRTKYCWPLTQYVSTLLSCRVKMSDITEQDKTQFCVVLSMHLSACQVKMHSRCMLVTIKRLSENWLSRPKGCKLTITTFSLLVFPPHDFSLIPSCSAGLLQSQMLNRASIPCTIGGISVK